MAERFYLNCPLPPGPLLVQGAEAHHLAHVSRLRQGDRLVLFNGDGNEYTAEVVAIHRREVAVTVLESQSPQRELDFQLIIAAPVPKGDRAQFLCEKLTELGVTAYVPLRTRRTIVQPREAKLERLERYVIEASKQCGRNVLLRIEPLIDWTDFCDRADLPANRQLAHVGEKAPPGRERHDTVFAVGPEGGFTDEEIACARNAQWQVIGLGPRILRIETAALVLAASR
jgi:16S rRNA (uracil1498-N3)-methyltransferase